VSTYAQATQVPADKSKQEIERTLQRYGATQFAYGWDAEVAIIGFKARGRQVLFRLPMPDLNDYAKTPDRGLWRSDEAQHKAWEQASRQRWRALALVIKAKLEAVEAGIVSFEDEFLAHTVLPSGETVSAWMQPQIEHAIEHGSMPSMLPALGTGR
jgi:hypothetical protein